MVFWCCARFIAAIEDMPKKDIADNMAIGEAGADAILTLQEREGPVRVLTHCNTGSLATSAYGTALGVIRSLHARDKLGNTLYQLHLTSSYNKALLSCQIDPVSKYKESIF